MSAIIMAILPRGSLVKRQAAQKHNQYERNIKQHNQQFYHVLSLHLQMPWPLQMCQAINRHSADYNITHVPP